MKPQEPDNLDELIADCADIPPVLTERKPVLPAPRPATRWVVDDAAVAQVAGIDEFV
ncbi:hypothetical protein V5P93_006130 [Actinokineospora auranticolor]|uniref:Uncharacterized protein n=1 Tax=Actinokineospora auranticolor TaxID=155976 RepID=A0A2S6GG88_9PSEU|nr:hypothetical protein [Actinokineospora auranticolor]PPK64220.1 hypothetical protein CLV40_12184 [Actinokineospora auranticolor]